MIEGRNIICFASNWFYDPTSKHHVMRALASKNHVIWINYHATRRPTASVSDLGAIAGKVGQFVCGPRQVAENIVVVTPAVLPLPGCQTAERVNRHLLARQIRAVLRDLPERPVQVWTFAPDVAPMRGVFGEELFLYYCVDEFAEFAGYDRAAIQRAESETLAAADAVVTTSAALFESKRRSNPNTLLVRHGVDLDHFATADSAKVPADVADIRGPVLGFFGLIAEWVDVELLAAVAQARREWTIVLIGEARGDVSPLVRMTNVRLLGRRPYAELPAYCRRFDAGLIPFRINALTRAVNPIKLREYLAAGLPVAATPLPEIGAYSSLVEVGATATEFVAACERALAAGDAGSRAWRRSAVAGESWADRVGQISTSLAEFSSGADRSELATQITPPRGRPRPASSRLSAISEAGHPLGRGK